MTESIEEIELSMWKDKMEEAKKLLHSSEEYARNDPLMTICDCNIEFKKLLDEDKGDDSSSKKFMDKVSLLAKKERKAKNLAETFDLIKALDNVNKAKLNLNMVLTKYTNLKFRYDLRLKP